MSTRPRRPPLRIPAASTPRRSKTPLILVAGVATYGLSLYAAYLYTSLKDLPVAPSHPALQPAHGKVYDVLARDYDTSIRFSELSMGLPLLRRRLARRARGHVLESAVGTGRNAAYYDARKCESITVVDSSLPMLEVARTAFARRTPSAARRVRFLHMDAAARTLPLAPDGGGYDFVVQSMGICSQRDPVSTLRNLGRCVKRDGRVLLLEHGRSRISWVNAVLDRLAPGHARRWGCWWNRDVGEVVRESGLRIVEVRRYHFGTTWWIEAVPGDDEEVGESG